MQRQLKFRIWDKNMRRWLCEDSQYLVLDGSEVLPAPWSTIGFKTNNETFVIQQFTGLKDKNGKEIYEGDIVSLGKTYPSWVIEFNDRIGAFTASGFLINTNVGRYVETIFLEIIGNIFENPELLK